MNDASSLAKPPVALAGWRLVAVLLSLLAATYVLAALSAVALQRYLLPWLPDDWSAALLRRGEGKLMTRALQIWLVILLPLGLRFSGWRGWRDCGWRNTTARPVWLDLAKGIAVGVATLGVLALFLYLTERRLASPLDPAKGIPWLIIGYAFSALIVSVFEETIARGIIFRIWSRLWGVVVAALVSSFLFAAAHFINPDGAAFKLPGFWQAAGALLMSALRLDTADAAFVIRLFNIALLGLALCAMVRLTGSIWLAVGAHAGWVWSIKLNNFFTDAVPPPLRSRFWGARGDLTDSTAGSLALLAVLLVVVWLIWRRERCTTTG
jgi:membrane protease YdiL (CAAX protease family)